MSDASSSVSAATASGGSIELSTMAAARARHGLAAVAAPAHLNISSRSGVSASLQLLARRCRRRQLQLSQLLLAPAAVLGV